MDIELYFFNKIYKLKLIEKCIKQKIYFYKPKNKIKNFFNFILKINHNEIKKNYQTSPLKKMMK